MPESGRLVLGIICALLLLITGPKIRKMAVIVGWLPGAHSYKAVVTDKWETPDRYTHYYNLSWKIDEAQGAAKTEANDRANYEDWSQLRIGSPVTVVAVGSEFFYSKSIYVDAGNFAFDFVLFALEVTGIIYGFGWFLKELWQERRASA